MSGQNFMRTINKKFSIRLFKNLMKLIRNILIMKIKHQLSKSQRYNTIMNLLLDLELLIETKHNIILNRNKETD